MQLGSLAPSYQQKKPSCGRIGEASSADGTSTEKPPIVPPDPPSEGDTSAKIKKYLPYIVVAVALYYIISKNK